MKKISEIRERYQKDPVPIRLGGIAANLARLHTLTKNAVSAEVITYLLNESKYLIEWVAPEAPLSIQSDLVELQVQLALWERSWNHINNDMQRRQAVSSQVSEWSVRILQHSGLLDMDR